MVKLEDLQTEEVVTLYQLREDSYRESAGGLQAHGVSEPKDISNLVHGLFSSEKGEAKRRLHELVKDRVNTGYSTPNYTGGEQSKGNLSTRIYLNEINVPKADIKEAGGELVYKNIIIE